MEQRNRNPYANVDWANCKRFTGDTHVHCTEMKFYERLMRTGVDFVTISNYYPSAPYWPLAKMTRNYYRCHHEHGLMMGHNAMTDLYSPVVNGTFVPGPFDWNKILDGWKDEIEEEYRSRLPFVEGGPLFPPLPAGTVEAPNAEHHGVTDAPGETHISGFGSFCATGTFDVRNYFHTFQHGFGCGSGMKWRDLFDAILAKLQYPDGGGVIINHPTWSHMKRELLLDMLDHDPRVLGIEALNGDCLRTETGWALDYWDYALSTGRQCFGFFATDHLVREPQPGRIKVLASEATAEAALRACRRGEFYGAFLGNGVQFTRIAAADGKLAAETDRPAKWQFISNRGVVREAEGTAAECAFGKQDLYLRITAEDADGEQIFSQATFADSL